MFTEIRVALVYQQEDGSQALRTALANAGVEVALLCRASELDSAAITATQVDAIVVNLDPELEDLLDRVTDVLDSAHQPVIYNDPAASSDLSGWDRARWLRHLSAKMKGQSNVTPPAPPGAQAIPMPVKFAPVAVPAVPAPADEFVMLTVAPASAAASKEPDAASAGGKAEAPDLMMDLQFGDLDLMFEEAPAAPVAAQPQAESVQSEAIADFELMFDEPVAANVAPATATTVDSDVKLPAFDDLDLMFEEPANLQQPAAQVAEAPAGDVAGLDELESLFASIDVDASGDRSVEPVSAPAPMEMDLDALFAEPAAAPERNSTAPVVAPSELTDLDALFREFEASQAASAAPANPRDATPAAPAKPAESKGPPLSWSLEPVEEVAPKGKAVPDKLIAEWRLDAPSKPITPAAPTVAPPPAAKPPSGPSIPAELEASLALADFKLLDEPVDAPGATKTANDLDRLDLSGIDLGPASAPESNLSIEMGDELGLDNLDFELELGTAELSRMHAASEGSSDHGALGDLDSLFEPVPETPTMGMSLADLNRVYVLGASIGGPEAIKAFLAQLPASIPAAFIVAQHMGGEFLQMMATQLNAASALSVRLAKAGERLRHGEVVVAPATDQLSVDERGYLQLNPAPSGSPYSPSIDHLAREISNRFGDHATLILFSGMGTDAVEGGRYLTARGGQVWAQERASCVIASMIDSAKSQGLIRFEGTPAQLAERVLQVVS